MAGFVNVLVTDQNSFGAGPTPEIEMMFPADGSAIRRHEVQGQERLLILFNGQAYPVEHVTYKELQKAFSEVSLNVLIASNFLSHLLIEEGHEKDFDGMVKKAALNKAMINLAPKQRQKMQTPRNG